jgi:hypothetical protein
VAQSQVVDWILNLKGDFLTKAAAAKTALRDLGAAAADNAKKLNQNQLLAQFESMSSLLIQVGGDVSQLGIIMSSAARPVATLTKTLGPLPLVLAAVPLAAVGMTMALRGIVDAAQEAEDRLKKLGVVTAQSASQELKDYKLAASSLGVELDKLKVALGEEVAPALTTMTQFLTVGIQKFGEFKDKVSDVKEVVQQLADVGIFFTTAGTLHAAMAGMSTFGAQPAPSVSLQQSGIGLAGEASRKVAEGQANYLKGVEQRSQEFEDEIELIREERRVKAEQLRVDKERLEHAKRLEAEESRMAARERERLFEESERIRGEIAEALARQLAGIQGGLDVISPGAMGTRMGQISQMTAGMNFNSSVTAAASVAAQAAVKTVLEEETFGRAPSSNFKVDPMGANALGSAFSGGGLGGVLGAAGAGPWGMVISAAAEGVVNDALEGLFDSVMKLVKTLPDQMGELIGKIVPDMVRAAPEMAASFAVLAPAIALSLVENAPALFSSLIDAILSLPQAFADAAAKSLTPSFLEGGNGNRGGRTGAVIGGIAGFAFGGPLGALVGGGLGAAAGNAAQRSQRGGGGGGIHIGQIVAPNPREFIRQIRESIGSFGLGETLNPFAA